MSVKTYRVDRAQGQYCVRNTETKEIQSFWGTEFYEASGCARDLNKGLATQRARAAVLERMRANKKKFVPTTTKLRVVK